MPRQNPAKNVPIEPADVANQYLAKRPDEKKARNREWDKKRSKATFDLPPELLEEINRIADDLTREYPNAKVRTSDVARKLLEVGLEAYQRGEVNITLEPAKFRIS